MDFDSMGDQVLPSFYAEDTANAMNAERRRESLAKCLRVVKADIEREKKAKAGVENLAKALQETPKFGGEERFLVTWDRTTDRVMYEILAVSRPNYRLARLGRPYVRLLQARFRRDSCAAMIRAVN